MVEKSLRDLGDSVPLSDRELQAFRELAAARHGT